MKKSYSELLKHPKWQKKRLEILNRDNFTCVYCGDKETELHVNHLKYTGKPHEAPNEDLETVCKNCHSIFHLEKKYKIHKIQKYLQSNGDIICVVNNDIGTDIYSIENNICKWVIGFLYNSPALKTIFDFNNDRYIIDWKETEFTYSDFGGKNKMFEKFDKDILKNGYDKYLVLDRINHSIAVELFEISKIDGLTIYLTHAGGCS